MSSKQLPLLIEDDLSTSLEKSLHELRVWLSKYGWHKNVNWVAHNFVFAVSEDFRETLACI